MEFGFEPVCDQIRAGSSSNLVADRFEAKFHYAILVADLVADLQRAGIWPITPYLAR